MYISGQCICVLCLPDTCTSKVHPVFNPVVPYGYLIPNMLIAGITNPDSCVCCCRTWISLDITRFCEKQRQPSSGSALPACPKTVNRAGRFNTICYEFSKGTLNFLI